MVSLLEDLGAYLEECPVILSDASAAIGICNRVGVGKVRHIEVNQLWLQEKVTKKKLSLVKVDTDDNLADALTKPVDAQAIQKHLVGIQAERLVDRHPAAPSCESDPQSVEEDTGDILEN